MHRIFNNTNYVTKCSSHVKSWKVDQEEGTEDAEQKKGRRNLGISYPHLPSQGHCLGLLVKKEWGKQ